MTAPSPTHSSPPNSTLYDQDYLGWLTETVRQLKQGDLAAVDVANLVEELEDMGRSERRAVESNLEVILMHLLKYRYQSEFCSNSWRFTLLEHRDRLAKSFRDSPSLKPYFANIFADCYAQARKKAAVETGIPLTTFPEDSPFTPDMTLDTDYLPDD
ncbi:MAG: DUF29 domain-containing protein [Leptolyngbyaceae cyanobacterium]